MGCNTVVAYKRRQASCPVRLRHFRRRDEGDFLRSSQRPICGISYMEMGWFDLGGSVRPMPRHPFTEPTGSRWRLRGRGDCNGVCLTDDFRRNTVTNRGSATPLHQLRHRHQTVVEASLAQPAELRRYASGGRGSGLLQRFRRAVLRATTSGIYFRGPRTGPTFVLLKGACVASLSRRGRSMVKFVQGHAAHHRPRLHWHRQRRPRLQLRYATCALTTHQGQ
jgi:hypothetical protein